MVKMGKRSAGESVERLATATAIKPAQPIRATTADRTSMSAVRADTLRKQSRFNGRNHLSLVRTPRQDRTHLSTLILRQRVDLLKPFPIVLPVHRIPRCYRVDPIRFCQICIAFANRAKNFCQYAGLPVRGNRWAKWNCPLGSG